MRFRGVCTADRYGFKGESLCAVAEHIMIQFKSDLLFRHSDLDKSENVFKSLLGNALSLADVLNLVLGLYRPERVDQLIRADGSQLYAVQSFSQRFKL